MLFIKLPSKNPYFNLAAEEYLMKNFTENFFLLWQNENTVVVGRNQNTLAEINAAFVNEHNVNVVRRMSGGGAVYHDDGNVNFSFILTDDSLFSDYSAFTEPITAFLKTLGVNAQLSGRNDILTDGKKISGNAQFMQNGRILHHGTLLFSCSEDKISEVLNVSEDKIRSKGIKSVKSRVTDISSHLKTPMTSEEFMQKLADYVVKNSENCTEYFLTEYDTAQIEKLKTEKYEKWEWNYGYSPKYDFKNKKRFSCGEVELLLSIGKNGKITTAKIYGDFFSPKPTDELCANLCGLKHKKDDIFKMLEKTNVSNYIFGLTNDDFINILF